jgi:hypothetical protein
MGFKNAEGPIIVSLESHMEVSPFWIEPHLDRLKNNKNLVTSVRAQDLSTETLAIEYDGRHWLTGIGIT